MWIRAAGLLAIQLDSASLEMVAGLVASGEASVRLAVVQGLGLQRFNNPNAMQIIRVTARTNGDPR